MARHASLCDVCLLPPILPHGAKWLSEFLGCLPFVCTAFYVYLPRINQSLEIFCDGWNNHGLRSEHHQTPLQLFTAGVINLGSFDSDNIHNLSSYGVEELDLCQLQLMKNREYTSCHST